MIRPRNHRRGVSLVIVLVALIVVTTVVGTMLRKLVIVNRQSKQYVYAAQAHALADSGVERAVAILRTKSDYGGEVWIPPDSNFAKHQPRVEIQVTRRAEEPSQSTIRVVATYPDGIALAVKSRREITVSSQLEEVPVASEED